MTVLLFPLIALLVLVLVLAMLIPLLLAAPLMGFMLAGIKLLMGDDDASWRAFFGFGAVLAVGLLIYWAQLN